MLYDAKMAATEDPIKWDFKLAHNFYESTKLTTSNGGFSSVNMTDRSFVNILFGSDDPNPVFPASLGDFDRLFKHLGTPLREPSNLQDTFAEFSNSPDNFDDLSKTYSLLLLSKSPAVSSKHLHKSPKMSYFQDSSIIHSPPSPPPSPPLFSPPSSSPIGSYESTDLIVQKLKEVYLDALTSPIVDIRSKFLDQPPQRKAQVQNLRLEVAHEKHSQLIVELSSRFNLPAFLNTPQIPGGNLSPAGIHIFVDWSNIAIGFGKHHANGQWQSHISNPEMSFRALSLVLERGQPVARRVLVGSRNPKFSCDREPVLIDAEHCGYELNLLDRVLKTRTTARVLKAKHGQGNGYATGYTTGSDSDPFAPKVLVEQGVDEILQMKIMESLLDAEQPSTIVLATGDGAEAEFSGGFFQAALRALKRGWKVQLVAWKGGLSKEYQSTIFRAQWGAQFQIIELEDFVQFMQA